MADSDGADGSAGFEAGEGSCGAAFEADAGGEAEASFGAGADLGYGCSAASKRSSVRSNANWSRFTCHRLSRLRRRRSCISFAGSSASFGGNAAFESDGAGGSAGGGAGSAGSGSSHRAY